MACPSQQFWRRAGVPPTLDWDSDPLPLPIGYQTKKQRGGGVGGSWKRDFAEDSACGRSSKCDGAIRTIFSLVGGNSSFRSCSVNSLFCCDFLAATMALQMGQGYLPSKVRVTDSDKECVRRLSASMVVHATVWSSAQCSPSMVASAATRSNLPVRIKMKAI